MKIPKTCKVCGIKFVAKRENQQFCKRRCFRIDYSRRTREANAVKRFPSFVCPACGQVHELDFSPAKDQKRWKNFICTKCKITNEETLKMTKEEDGISSTY